MLKVSDNPPILSPNLASVTDFSGALWVAHTKARCEKAFAWEMHAQGVGYFLPMISRVTFSGGRKRRGMYPLFPGYVFFSGDEQTRYRALVTDRLCQVIPVVEREKLIAELSGMEKAILSGLELSLYPFAVVGKLCRVARGPLQGVIGTVVRQQGVARFVLQVSVLGNGAMLEIDGDVLEAAE